MSRITSNMIVFILANFAFICSADIRLGTQKEWQRPGGNANIDNWEASKLDAAAMNLATMLNAAPKMKPQQDLAFLLFFGNQKYYVAPMLFMAREHEGEICTPARFKNTPTYKCEEGQTLAFSCHLMFFNDRFENVGIFRFWPQENYVSFCNSVIAMGTADKTRNELLVVYQYFNTHAKAAGSVSELGSGWKRMTSLVRLQLDNGKITAVEDYSCLKNPNTIDTIPDARAALKQCAHEKK